MTTSKQKTVILIAGPTAVGKTRLALMLARHYQTAIISADSRQCYREMSIGTAKPTAAELQAVTHYFINSHSVKDEVNAGMFEQAGLRYLSHIFSGNDVAIVCGGTGLYIRALLDGIDVMPAIPENIQAQVQQLYAQKGLNGLQQALKEKDPVFYQQAEQKNPHRLMRALAVWEATGQSILSFRKNKKVRRPFNIVRLGLYLPKEQLLENITSRTKQMLANGLVDEVNALQDFRNLQALQTVGYTEIFQYLDKKCDLPAAEKEIIIHTRQYAKRQMTWFKKDAEINWFHADAPEEAMHFIQNEINNFAGLSNE